MAGWPVGMNQMTGGVPFGEQGGGGLQADACVRDFVGRIERGSLAVAAEKWQVSRIQLTTTRPARRPTSLRRRYPELVQS